MIRPSVDVDFYRDIMKRYTAPSFGISTQAELIYLQPEQAGEESQTPRYENTVNNIYNITRLLEENTMVNLQLSYSFISSMVSKAVGDMAKTVASNTAMLGMGPASSAPAPQKALPTAMDHILSTAPAAENQPMAIKADAAFLPQIVHPQARHEDRDTIRAAQSQIQLLHTRESRITEKMTVLERAFQAERQAQKILKQHYLEVRRQKEQLQPTQLEIQLLQPAKEQITLTKQQRSRKNNTEKASSEGSKTPQQSTREVRQQRGKILRQQEKSVLSQRTQPEAAPAAMLHPDILRMDELGAVLQENSQSSFQAATLKPSKISKIREKPFDDKQPEPAEGSTTAEKIDQLAPTTVRRTAAPPTSPSLVFAEQVGNNKITGHDETVREMVANRSTLIQPGSRTDEAAAFGQAQTPAQRTSMIYRQKKQQEDQQESRRGEQLQPVAERTTAPAGPSPMVHAAPAIPAEEALKAFLAPWAMHSSSTSSIQGEADTQANLAAAATLVGHSKEAPAGVIRNKQFADAVFQPAAMMQPISSLQPWPAPTLTHKDGGLQTMYPTAPGMQPPMQQAGQVSKKRSTSRSQPEGQNTPLVYAPVGQHGLPREGEAPQTPAFVSVPLLHDFSDSRPPQQQNSSDDHDFQIIKTTRVMKDTETVETTKTQNIAINVPQEQAAPANRQTRPEAGYVPSQAEVARLADKVYKVLEQRLRTEKNRRGMH